MLPSPLRSFSPLERQINGSLKLKISPLPLSLLGGWESEMSPIFESTKQSLLISVPKGILYSSKIFWDKGEARLYRSVSAVAPPLPAYQEAPTVTGCPAQPFSLWRCHFHVNCWWPSPFFCCLCSEVWKASRWLLLFFQLRHLVSFGLYFQMPWFVFIPFSFLDSVTGTKVNSSLLAIHQNIFFLFCLISSLFMSLPNFIQVI